LVTNIDRFRLLCQIANSSPVLEDVDIKFYFSQGQDLVTAFAAIIHDFSRSRIVNLTIRDAFDSLSSEDGEIAGAMAGLTRLQTFTLCSTPGFYHTILPPLLSMPTLTKISLTSSRDSRVIVNLVDTQAIAALLRMDGKICIILRGLEFPAQSSWELCNAIAESRVEKLQIEICGFDSLLPARSLGPSHLKDLQIIGCWNNLHTNVRQFLAAVLLNVPRLERLELTQLDGPYFSKTAVYAESVAKTQSTSSFL
jgi:hypothetical protein